MDVGVLRWQIIRHIHSIMIINLTHPHVRLDRTTMDPEPIKARVIRMPMIRFDPQLDNTILSVNLFVLHVKVLITGCLIRIRVLVRSKLHGLLVVLILQTLKQIMKLG